MACLCCNVFAAITPADTLTNDTLPTPSRYERNVERYKSRLSKLIPTHTRIQFYGDMGLFSLGVGWDYGKRKQWETDFLIGIVPKYNADHAHVTLTLKQGFLPWELDLGKSFQFNPLTCGAYINAILGDEYWTSQPGKYPKGYYWFSTRMQLYIYVGQSITYVIPENHRRRCKDISFFYEIGTNDKYILSKYSNSSLSVFDILRLSFGVKFGIF